MIYEEDIRRIIAKKTELTENIETLDINDSFQDFGIDSLSFISVIVEIEDYFELEFPDDKLIMTEASTIKQLCEIVESIKNSKIEY